MAGRAAVAELKKAVRKVAKGRLAALAPDAKSKQSAAVAETLCASPHFVEATSVAVYLSMAEEVDTDAIIRRVFESGKRCYVPRFKGDTMDMWTAESVDDIAGFPRGKWDIVQPEHDLETRVSALGNDGQVDLVIVPGLAFTEDGGRLGRGKGFYDRFLSTLRERASELDRPRPAAVGIAFGEQRFDEVPTDQYDVTLDAVVFGE